MPESIVRAARAGDAPQIADVYNQSIAARDATMDTEPVSSEAVSAWLNALRSDEAILVIASGASVYGWGIVKRYSERPGYRVAAETSVYLDRRHRGLGYGRRLQEALMAFARKAGYHHLVAKIWADNAISLQLHERVGFEVVGVQREIGLVDGVRRDVTVMQCVLSDQR